MNRRATRQSFFNFVLGKVVEDALKVFCDFRCKLDSRHRLLARQLLCGGAGYFFAGNLVFQIALHVRPWNRSAGCDDGRVTRLRDTQKIVFYKIQATATFATYR